ncbi:MAG: hypothetical protein EOP11_17415 [Proteobacteria bacterium]|nr:MAG: hypothetical protein EOP11_17415 [Pseudomonadota bacterium]
MKRAAKFAWSFVGTLVPAFLLFFFLIGPARAPHGGKNSLGGRTIASTQETEFDRQLLKYHLCYGVDFNPSKATLERRRECKALVVHRLQLALDRPGAYLKDPLEFQCENTVFGKPNLETSAISVVLKPNAEFTAMDEALSRSVEIANVAESTDRAVKQACEFLTDCKWATRPDSLSLRKIGSCLSTPNLTHRRMLVDEVAGMLFKVPGNRTKELYGSLLQQTP